MEISKELIQGEPVWNDFVAELLRRVPIFSKQDSIKEHKKRHIQPGVELNICHQGRALVVVGNDMFMQSPDQLVLIPGHIPHQIYPGDRNGTALILCLESTISGSIKAACFEQAGGT